MFAAHLPACAGAFPSFGICFDVLSRAARLEICCARLPVIFRHKRNLPLRDQSFPWSSCRQCSYHRHSGGGKEEAAMKTKCRAAIVTWLTLALSGVAMAAQQTTTPAPDAQPGSATSSSTSTPTLPPPATPQTINPNTPEMSSREETSTTFKVKVNLVEVRAVVRDTQGNAVGNLRKEDFQLTDNGKPQVITKFSMEQPGAKPVAKPPNSGTDLDDAAPGLPL